MDSLRLKRKRLENDQEKIEKDNLKIANEIRILQAKIWKNEYEESKYKAQINEVNVILKNPIALNLEFYLPYDLILLCMDYNSWHICKVSNHYEPKLFNCQNKQYFANGKCRFFQRQIYFEDENDNEVWNYIMRWYPITIDMYKFQYAKDCHFETCQVTIFSNHIHLYGSGLSLSFPRV